MGHRHVDVKVKSGFTHEEPVEMWLASENKPGEQKANEDEDAELHLR